MDSQAAEKLTSEGGSHRHAVDPCAEQDLLLDDEMMESLLCIRNALHNYGRLDLADLICSNDPLEMIDAINEIEGAGYVGVAVEIKNIAYELLLGYRAQS